MCSGATCACRKFDFLGHDGMRHTLPLHQVSLVGPVVKQLKRLSRLSATLPWGLRKLKDGFTVLKMTKLQQTMPSVPADLQQSRNEDVVEKVPTLIVEDQWPTKCGVPQASQALSFPDLLVISGCSPS